MGVNKSRDACRLGELLPAFVDALGPVHDRFDSVADAWEGLLPGNLRSHCRVGSFTGGCLRVLADGSSYICELQFSKADLLRELQRLCPGARVRRIEVSMAR
ncbi:MAG: DUF721 domain-containing protein [Sedimentisphaerales bacterium]|nr:DUF721 domain-containing protein [Sedimentisphaerales bacterium]